MSRKPIRPAIKASRAASLAALKTVPARPPSASTSPRQTQRRKALRRRQARSRADRASSRSSRSTGSARRSGQFSAKPIAPRMSEGPSWAMIEPSVNSTMRMDDRLRMDQHLDLRRGRTSKSARASITSSALLNIVALSIEIRSPMSQFGCARAWAGVAAAIRASDQSRNGPPEAVRISRSISPRGSSRSSLEDRAVLAVDRAGAGCRARRRSAAADRRRRPGSPCWRARGHRHAGRVRGPAPGRRRRRSPTSPSRPAPPPRRRSASGPAAARMPLPASAVGELGQAVAGSAVTATRAPSRRACSASSATLAAAGQRDDLVALARRPAPR